MAFVVPRPRVWPGASLLESIGNTPLVRLEKVASEAPGVEVCAKAEFLNPGGSVKDRAALNMILDGERSGRLKPGRVILDATSGNTGIAYAMIGAVRGYRVKLCLPRNASPERVRTLRAYGAQIVGTPAEEGSDGAIRRCREIYREDPDRYFYPDQYNNPANWKAHYETTGLEILRQTAGRVTHFVAALGTTGTFGGVTRRLREDHEVRCISVQPSSGFHGIEGTKHMPTSLAPGIYDPKLADENLWVETEAAQRMTRRLAREEGLYVGISSGANVAGAVEVARRLERAGERGVVVTVLCDGGGRYSSEGFWDDPD
jgi:cysteine synthase B